MDNDFFQLLLDDYSAASFTSFGKAYYGTLEDISSLFEAIRKDEKYSDHDFEAFDRYMFGEHNVTHKVAYREVPFLVKAKIIASATQELNNYKWEHLNTWRWPYYIKCDKAECTHLWVSCKRSYSRVLRVVFTNLQYKGISDKYGQLGFSVWGYPHQIKIEGEFLSNRLFVEEKTFKNKSEVLNDYETFKTSADVNFTEVLNDIFGDG